MRIVASGILSHAEPGTTRANLTFPTVTSLADGTLLATLRAGDVKDSAAERIEFYRSEDGGASWSGPVYPFVPPEVGGKGGSLGMADPAERMAFGYVMNAHGEGILLNDKGQALVDATYRALGFRTDAPGVWVR